MSTDDRDLLEVIEQDHREALRLLSQLAATREPVQARDLAERLITGLVRHIVAEERHLVPLVGRALSDGARLADRFLEHLHDLQEQLKVLEATGPGDPRFVDVLDDVRDRVSAHADHLDQVLLPQLRTCCRPDELSVRGWKMLAAEQQSPVRPHPGLPTNPNLLAVLGPGVSLVDRIRAQLD